MRPNYSVDKTAKNSSNIINHNNELIHGSVLLKSNKSRNCIPHHTWNDSLYPEGHLDLKEFVKFSWEFQDDLISLYEAPTVALVKRLWRNTWICIFIKSDDRSFLIQGIPHLWSSCRRVKNFLSNLFKNRQTSQINHITSLVEVIMSNLTVFSLMDSSICLRSFSYHESSHTSLLPTCRFTGSGRCSAPYWQGCPMTSSLHAAPLVRSWWPVWPVRTSRSWRRQAWQDRRCLQSRKTPWEPSRPASRKTTEETCTKKAHSVQQRFLYTWSK